MKILAIILLCILITPPILYFIVMPYIILPKRVVDEQTIHALYWITFIDYILIFSMLVICYISKK